MVSLTLRQAESYPRWVDEPRCLLCPALHLAWQPLHLLGFCVGIPQSKQMVLGIVIFCAIEVRLEQDVI